LNERANRVAHYLRTLGVGPEVLVALCFERSIDILTGIVGTLKAGGVYLPLDPEHPSERLATMLSEAKPAVALCSEQFRHRTAPFGIPTLCLDSDWSRFASHGA